MFHFLLPLMLGMASLADGLEPIQALQSYSRLITSGAGHVSYHSVWDELGLRKMAEAQRLAIQSGERVIFPVDVHDQLFIAFKKDKLRWELVDTTQRSGTTYITDWRGVLVNGRWKAVDYSRELGEVVRGIGYTKDPNVGPFNPSLDIRPSSLAAGIAEPLIELLQGNSELWGQLTVQRLGSETVDGLSCERFRLSNDRVIINVWLSKEHGYLPIRIENLYVVNANRHVFRYTYRSYGEGLWFVSRIDIQNICSFDGKEGLFSHQMIKVEDDFRINIELPDDIFQIKFYKGQEVRVWQGRTYKVIRWGQE